jgi:hypothetical protein
LIASELSILFHGSQGMWLIFPACGDAEKISLVLLGYGAAELRSSEATLWRASVADPLFLPPLMVEGRLLRSSSSATPSPGRGSRWYSTSRWLCQGGLVAPVRYAPTAPPQVVLSPAAMWLTVLQSSVMVEKELDSIAFPKILLGSFVKIVRIGV